VVQVPSLEGKAAQGGRGRVQLSLSPPPNVKKVSASAANCRVLVAFSTSLTPECGGASDSSAVGYTFHEGDIIMYSPYVSQGMPEQFCEPEVFRPERFDPVQGEKRLPGAFIPFGAGPRTAWALRLP